MNTDEYKLERRLDAMERTLAILERRIEALEGLERTNREVELDVAAIVRELRSTILPNLLPGNKPLRRGHRILSPEARADTQRATLAIARSVRAQKIKDRKGLV